MTALLLALIVMAYLLLATLGDAVRERRSLADDAERLARRGRR